MKQTTYSKFGIAIRLLLALIFVVYSFINIYYLTRFYANDACIFTYLDSIVEIIFLTIASLYLIKSCLSIIYLDENGLSRYSFGKLKNHLNWVDINDYGYGKRITPFGYKQRFYLSTKTLNEQEKNNLSLADDYCIYFSYLKKQTIEYLKQYKNIDI